MTAAERVAHQVHQRWAQRPAMNTVLAAMLEVAEQVTQLHQPADALYLYRPLTPAQAVTLQACVDGASNQEIADKLGLGVDTVKSHISSVMHKLGAKNRLHAVVIAHRLGLVDLGGGR